MAAGDSISIRGSEIAGNGDVSLLAQNSIDVVAVADKYVSRNKKSTFKKSYQETGVIQSSGITSGYGDVSMQTQTGDITVLGSAVNAGLLGDTGGVIHLKAGHDVITDMTHVETKTKKSGFGGMGIGIGYSSTQSNGHEVALTGFNGDRVVLEAEHDVRVTATQFNTTTGDVILHGKNQTIVDAGLLDYYLKKGSTGISFSASAGGFLGAAGLNTNSLTGDNDFIGQSPILSSLRTLNNSKGDIGTAMSLVNVGAQLSMFNGGSGLGAGLFGGPSVGITLGTNKSTTKWQQLYPSMFNVAGEVIIKGDHGAQVLGGAVIDAKQGITLDSGVGRLIVEAGATQSSSKNSSASIGVSYGAGGLTFSAGGSKGQSKGTSYSPVQLITDGTLTIRSQNGADFLGVVTDVNKVDVGVIGDVNVVTLQNQFHSKSSGFGVSFTYGPGMATGSGISASSSKTDRVFTANQTSIIGKESTVWNVSGNTNLVGSVVAQGTYDDQGIFHDGGNMVFNSGSVSYTHLNDKDISKSISGGINIGERPVNQAPQDKETSGSGTLSIDFSTTKGLTLATLGNGQVTLGSGNIDGINRDVNGSQIITEHDVQRGTITVTPEMLTDPVGTVEKIGKNLGTIATQIPDIPSELAQEGYAVGSQLDKVPYANTLLLDIFPADSNNGGLLSLPGTMIKGDRVYVLTKDGSTKSYALEEVRNNPEVVQEIIAYSWNGINNTRGEADNNATSQLGISDGNYGIAYSPTKGLIPDVLEATWLKLFGGIFPTANVLQDREFVQIIKDQNEIGTKFKLAGHSNGATQLYLLMDGVPAGTFSGSNVQFSGAPINEYFLQKATQNAIGQDMNAYVQINQGDFVGMGLGMNGNPIEFIYSVLRAPLLATKWSDHSHYPCMMCAATPSPISHPNR